MVHVGIEVWLLAKVSDPSKAPGPANPCIVYLNQARLTFVNEVQCILNSCETCIVYQNWFEKLLLPAALVEREAYHSMTSQRQTVPV
jgi:hypothetical protein